MSSCRVSRDYLGWAAIKKLGGNGPVATNTQINIPAALVSPRNPEAIDFPPVINSAQGPTVSIQSKKSPSVLLSTYVKSDWFSANLLNSLLISLDSCNNTDLWAIGVRDDGATTRVWDDARCASVTLAQSAPGGPITFDALFVATFGENEKSTPTSFVAPSAPSTGSLVDVAHVDFGATTPTANMVTGWSLTLTRQQTYVYEIDGTLYAAGIATGAFGGRLTLVQSPRATVVPSTSATIRVWTGDPPGGNKVTFSMNLRLLELRRDHTPDFGSVVREYAIIQLGGSPITIS